MIVSKSSLHHYRLLHHRYQDVTIAFIHLTNHAESIQITDNADRLKQTMVRMYVLILKHFLRWKQWSCWLRYVLHGTRYAS